MNRVKMVNMAQEKHKVTRGCISATHGTNKKQAQMYFFFCVCLVPKCKSVVTTLQVIVVYSLCACRFLHMSVPAFVCLFMHIAFCPAVCVCYVHISVAVKLNTPSILTL